MMKWLALATLVFAISVQAPAGEMMAPTSSQGPKLGGGLTLKGIYRAAAKEGTDPTASLQIGDPAQRTPRYRFLTFFADGRVKKGLTVLGLDEYMAESQMRHDIASGGNYASQWGVYQIRGSQGRIVFADARLAGQQLVYGLRGEVWQMVLHPDSLEIQGDTYVRLYGGNGMHLHGVYKPYGDPKAPGITFTDEGEFIDEGILKTGTATAMAMSGGGVTMAYGFGSPGPGRGTYDIIRYGLHLNYANGQAPDCLFFLEAGETKDNVQVLYINNVKYQRIR
jgi:hypothetical protein